MEEQVLDEFVRKVSAAMVGAKGSIVGVGVGVKVGVEVGRGSAE